MNFIFIAIVLIALLSTNLGMAESMSSIGFLAGASLKTARTRAIAKARLLGEARGLAASLRHELGRGALGARNAIPVAVVDDARRRLWQEADGLFDVGAGDLLRDYAAYAPAHVLVIPSTDPFEALTADEGLGSSSEYSSVTKSTVTGNDGQVITRTMTCQNGVCERHVQTRASPTTKLLNGATQGTSEARSGSANTQKSLQEQLLSNRIAAESRRLARDMERMRREFGDDEFGDIVGDIFRMPHVSIPNISDSTVGARSNYGSSQESQTSITNGHVVQKTTICKAGKCHTTQTERDLKPQVDDTKGSLDNGVGADSGSSAHIPWAVNTPKPELMPILLRLPSAQI